jgi:thiol-disulfide isomerase/thioredoxin
MRKTLAVSFLVITALLIQSCGSGGKKAEDAAKGNSVQLGDRKAISDFKFTDIDGVTSNLSDYKGKVVILDFWATWCPPCKAELPAFVNLKTKFGEKGLVIIGMSLDKGFSKEAMVTFGQGYNLNYPVVIVENNQFVSDAIEAVIGKIASIPTTLVIDKKGLLVKKYIGLTPEAEFEGVITKLLEEQPI